MTMHPNYGDYRDPYSRSYIVREPEPSPKSAARAIEAPKRAGDEHRERYISHLNDLFASGYLSHDEYEKRSTQAQHAVMQGDLAGLITDLPALAVPATGRSRLRKVANGAVVRGSFHLGTACACVALAVILPLIVSGWTFSVLHAIELAAGMGAAVVIFVVNIVAFIDWGDG